ncbi:MAG: CoA-binding protein, partial [Deltaproteobacteria bacterium]|nr:CoA-binding protein [Deltaproteobacteria bacterium]
MNVFLSGKGSESADLTSFFEPESLAVIGSFKEGFFGGYVVVKSLLRGGFQGRIYPVNPRYREVLGLRVYPSLTAVPGRVDLVLIMINARSVSQLIHECGDKGVRAVVVIADGFAERDEEGARLQREIVTLARQRGIRLMGPNTAGIVNTGNGLYPCPYEAGYERIRKGPVTLFSQTGMINPQAFPYPDLRCGISKICDLGNKCDVDE